MTAEGEKKKKAIQRYSPPKSGDRINGFTLENVIQKSGDCYVFVCYYLDDINRKYVTKIGVRTEASRLALEIQHYKSLDGITGIPQYFYAKNWSVCDEHWDNTDWSQIVIEKLLNWFSNTSSPTLSLMQTLSLEELIPIAVQQIDALESVHSRGLLHRGVKPDNFVMSEDMTKVYLIDFNKSKSYLRPNGNHVIKRQNIEKLPIGLPFFHSINYLNGCRRSRRDDMESLGLCWVYLLKGELPWSRVKRYPNQFSNYIKSIRSVVNKISIQDICKGLPENIEKYLQICRQMDFYSEPNYEELRRLIANISIDLNYNQNNQNNDINMNSV